MNAPTIIIGLIILAVFAAIVGKGIYNRRHGKSSCSCGGSCGGGCGHCASSGLCHPEKQPPGRGWRPLVKESYMELTNTNVRYLLTIYHLSQARLEVSSKDIAQTLDVSRASVTSMMSILTDKRLVTKERYGKVHLTDDGYRWARVLASQTDKLAETLQNRMELSY